MAVDLSATNSLPDAVAIDDAAAGLAEWGESFAETFESAAGQWAQLTGLYEAPEQEVVLGAMDRPKQTAAAVGDITAAATKALQIFATEVQAIQSAHTQLVTEAAALEAEDGDDGGLGVRPAQDDLRFRLKEQELQDRANRLAERYQAAQDDCSRTLSKFERSSTDVPLRYPALGQNGANSESFDIRPSAFEVAGGTALFHRLSTGAVSNPAAGFGKYLSFLAGLNAGQLSRFVQSNPAAALSVPPRGAGRDPMANRAWWQNLEPAMKDQIAEQLPSLVGNLEGLDYTTRAAANATALSLAASQPFITGQQRQSYKNIKKSLIERTRGGGQRSLISFTPSTEPLAAVAIGDLDTADYVAFNVPGMGSNTRRMTEWTEASQSIYDQQGRISLGIEQAVVAWIGYDSPEMFPGSMEVLAMDSAQTGDNRLTATLEGFQTTRTAGGAMPFTSVTAHSYGTTTAANALTQISFDVDAAAFYGSAGVDPDVVDQAKDLHVVTDKNGNPEVYATQATGERIATEGIAWSKWGDDPRISPTTRAFGAKVFSSEGTNGLAPTTGHSALGKGEHFIEFWKTDEGGGYLDDDTQSLFNISRIVSGQGEQVATVDADLNHLRLEDPYRISQPHER